MGSISISHIGKLFPVLKSLISSKMGNNNTFFPFPNPKLSLEKTSNHSFAKLINIQRNSYYDKTEREHSFMIWKACRRDN